MVRGPIRVPLLQRQAQDLAKEVRIHLGDGPQSFQVAGAGRFQMDQVARMAGKDRIHTEFVRAGVDAELVWPQETGNCGMFGHLRIKGIQIADIVHPLFETAHVAWRQTDPPHPQSL